MSEPRDNRALTMNMTKFFNRELMLYALEDFRFKKPISFKKIGYIVAFILLFSAPIVYFFGFHLNVYFVGLLILPPFVLGNLAVKPIFGGRELLSYLLVTITYLSQPRAWTDLNATREKRNERVFIDHIYWVSRRREIKIIKDLKEEEVKANV